MITTTTITLNDKVKEAGKKRAKELNIRGGFSAYIQTLINSDIIKAEKRTDKVYYAKES